MTAMEMPSSETIISIMVVIVLLTPDLLLWLTPLLPEKYNVENKIYEMGSSLNVLPKWQINSSFCSTWHLLQTWNSNRLRRSGMIS